MDDLDNLIADTITREYETHALMIRPLVWALEPDLMIGECANCAATVIANPDGSNATHRHNGSRDCAAPRI